MKDPRITSQMDPKKFPFDAKRMFWAASRVKKEATGRCITCRGET